jgi:hypothetical protein
VPEPGDHKYVPPAIDGDAVKVAEDPLQITCELTVTVGRGFTVIVPTAVFEHPLVVPVTV